MARQAVTLVAKLEQLEIDITERPKVAVANPVPKCGFHGDREARYWCAQEQSIVCEQCKHSTHAGHVLVSFQDGVDAAISVLEQRAADLREESIKVGEHLNDCKAALETLNTELEAHTQRVGKEYKQMLEKSSLLSLLSTLTAETQRMLQDRISSAQEHSLLLSLSVNTLQICTRLKNIPPPWEPHLCVLLLNQQITLDKELKQAGVAASRWCRFVPEAIAARARVQFPNDPWAAIAKGADEEKKEPLAFLPTTKDIVLSNNNATATLTTNKQWRTVVCSTALVPRGKHTIWFRFSGSIGLRAVGVGPPTLTDTPGDFAVGSQQGWGYESHGCKLPRKSRFDGSYYGCDWRKWGPHTVALEVDFEADTISFSVNGTSQGVAFSNINLKNAGPLHPAASIHCYEQSISILD